MRFDGTIALVTGASRGLGKAIVAGLLAEGARVVATGRDEGRLRAAFPEVPAEQLRLVEADASCERDVRRTFDTAESHFGVPSVVVNNAGVALLAPVGDTTAEQWETIMTGNATSVFLGCREAVTRMIRAAVRGTIVNVASVSGEVGSPLACAYSASKGAVLALTKALAREVAPRGITVNAVNPGAMDTAMFHHDTLDAMAARFGTTHDVLLAATVKAVPLGRLLTAEEVAGLILFLASSAARGMTGETVGLSAGFDIH